MEKSLAWVCKTNCVHADCAEHRTPTCRMCDKVIFFDEMFSAVSGRGFIPIHQKCKEAWDNRGDVEEGSE